jgi:hypothetical protein
MKKALPETDFQKYRTFILIGGVGAIISAIVLALLFFGTKGIEEPEEIKEPGAAEEGQGKN